MLHSLLLQEQLAGVEGEVARLGLELRDMQLHSGRLGSELQLKQRESEERDRQLQVWAYFYFSSYSLFCTESQAPLYCRKP